MVVATRMEELRRIRYVRRTARSICKNLKITTPKINLMSVETQIKEGAVGLCFYDDGGEKTSIKIAVTNCKNKLFSYRFVLHTLLHELTHAWEHSITRGDILIHDTRFKELLKLVRAATPDGYKKAKTFPWEV